MADRLLRAGLYALFALSGAAGLVYESVWSHYLKLFLGHAAYAQALVLVMYMGGLALGAWLAGRWMHRLRRLLSAYAAIELLIGLMGLVFHALFTTARGWAFGTVVPALGDGPATTAFTWLLAAALITPQAVLLGATFPLMSNGVMRRFPGLPGARVAMLYFSNSAGAAAGVLVCGFVLIPATGYPGAVLAAGLINIAVALLVYLLARGERAATSAPPPVSAAALPRVLLAAALFTGAASFVYEIAWVRMLSMVFGASTHSFELMLATFIAGLALGGLAVRGLVDRVRDPLSLLVRVQVAMGLAAALTIPLYNHVFDLMALLMQAIARSEPGYTLFGVLRAVLAVAVMLPATLLAGATLPLLTRLLLDRGLGERSVSHVYAANTVGAIAGVLFAVGIGLPWLGLERLVAAGSLLDIGIGVLLLAGLGGVAARRGDALAAGAAVLGVVLLVAVVQFDPRRMAGAVYREGVAALPAGVEMLFTADGRTASIAVWRHGPRVLLATNGKPDASIAVDPGAEPTLDDVTQTLLGALPLAVRPDAREAAVIGLGSGTTSAALLDSPHIERVDTIEIERAVLAGARHFAPRNDAVYDDPRSRLLVADAKTVFATRRGRYDVIVSEPSNPWVSGVASLFTSEFYATLADALAPGGVLVQWLQLYEMDRDLLATVFRALAPSFPDYHLYAVTGGDLIVVARRDGPVPAAGDAVFGFDAARARLARLGIDGADGLRVRALGDRRLLGALLEAPHVPANSDYFPVLDTRAPLARFLRADALDLAASRAAPLPVVAMLAPGFEVRDGAAIGRVPDHRFAAGVAEARTLLAQVLAEGVEVDGGAAALPVAALAVRLADDCTAPPALWRATLLAVSRQTAAYLTAAENARLWRRLAAACPGDATRRPWLALFEATGQRDGAGMAEAAGRLLRDEAMEPAVRGHLLAAASLGLLATGDVDEAREAWAVARATVLGEAALPFHLAVLEALLAR